MLLSGCRDGGMEMSPVVISRRRGRMECDVLAVSDWAGFEKLARFLEKYYGALVLERLDGPDARRWVIGIGQIIIELQHEDPWGNVIVAPEPSADAIVQQIADDLHSRLVGLSPNRD